MLSAGREREAAAEVHRLKELEAARQLQAAREDADKLRLRLSQGQANYQGAALEADVADRLRQAFPPMRSAWCAPASAAVTSCS